MKKRYKWFSFTSENEQAEYNVFCFPHAGAGASIYAPWGKTLPESFSFFPVQLPMRENRKSEALPQSLQELGKAVAEDNAELFRSKPFILFGHCFGALAAYETARYLRQNGIGTPALLILASSVAPRVISTPFDLDSMDKAQLTEHFINIGYISKDMANSQAYLDFFIPALKEDCKLVYKYVPDDTVLNCPIYAPFGSDDIQTPEAEARKWSERTSSSFAAESYSGDHFFLSADLFPKMLEKALNTVKENG